MYNYMNGKKEREKHLYKTEIYLASHCTPAKACLKHSVHDHLQWHPQSVGNTSRLRVLDHKITSVAVRFRAWIALGNEGRNPYVVLDATVVNSSGCQCFGCIYV
jgi:hypothetical protein